MIEQVFTADIRSSAEKIFDIISDFNGQSRWLRKSLAFRGTDQISTDPVALGTTYREPGLVGVRHGTVTELARPTHITFHQPMTMRVHLGTVDATIRYELRPGDGSTKVTEFVTVGLSGPAKLMEPVFRPLFRRERQRTLRALEKFAERSSLL